MDDLEAAFEALRAKRKKDEPQAKGKGKKAAQPADQAGARSADRKAGVQQPDPVRKPAPAQGAGRAKADAIRSAPAAVKAAPARPIAPAPATEPAPTGLRKPSAAEAKARRAIERQQPIADEVLPPAAAHEAFDRTFGYKGVQPPPFVRDPITEAMKPKRHAPGSLKVGDSVWFCNQRYWITQAPPDWDDTAHIQISSIAMRPGTAPPNNAHITFVHADALELAPVKGPSFAAQPTKHAVETEKRKKEFGISHVGDDVGAMLQGRSLDEVYAIAAKYLGVPEAELRSKYGKLNPGQQRMLCGNKMRAEAKKRG